jgi:hypothetical protein
MVFKTPLITAQKPILDIANSTRSPLLAFTLSPINLHFLFGFGPASLPDHAPEIFLFQPAQHA